MRNALDVRCMASIEQKVLQEAARASLDFACPHCGRLLRIPLDQSRIPDAFPCGRSFELTVANQN